MLFYTSQLKDYNIVATDGELGKVKDLYVDDQKWDLRYVSIDTRKWLPGKKVLLSPTSFVGVNEEEKKLEVKYDKETVRNSPDVPEESQLSRETEQRLEEYYGWGPNLADPVIYGGGQMATVNLIRTPQPTTTEPLYDPVNPEDDLRSGDEVIGFRVHANNGKLGNVADFIYDDAHWKIRYVVVESRDSILNTKYYVYNTDKIESADWLEGDLYINGSLETLERAELFNNKEDIVASLI
ncbi:PRC-barrel domain-containing protein [Oceanobacillus rekensis]|uniref:PRC-barrel domain-containing protein n=1 Tax=Oceanobacillus rekensis TaxID=937927 RepID=UPI000B42E985|nr:PRC-barrel domain-containing protein [Oceanobacillus rekensis]